MSEIRRAVLVEPAATAALSALLATRPFGLMPAGPHTILGRQLAALAGAGIREVRLLLGSFPHLTRHYVGAGVKWGLAIKCHSIADPARLALDPDRAQRYLAGDGLVLGMDVFLSPEELRDALAIAGEGCTHYCDVQRDVLPFFVIKGTSRARATRELVTVLRIDSPRSLWQANRRVLRQHGNTLHTERNVGDRCFIGRSTRVAPSACLRGPLLLDTGVAVAARASLGPEVLVGRGAMISRGAEISRSIVFEDTHIGPHATIRDKIVDGGTVVDMATGEAAYIDDPAILGRVRDQGRGRRWSTAAAEWFLALVGLTALAMPLLFQCARNAAVGRPCMTRTEHFLPLRRALDGGVIYRKLRLWSVVGAWERAPWLLAVLAGRLALVGSRLPLARPGDTAGSLDHAYGMLRAALAPRGASQPDTQDTDMPLMEYRLNAGPAQSWRVFFHWLVRSARIHAEGETDYA